MADSRDGDFLSRWSRRKQGEPPEQAPVEPIAQVAEVADADPSDEGAPPEAEGDPPEAEGDPEVIARLPDVDSMDDSSDFTVFLQAGVPEALRRRALRKLWRVNPVLANLDGLNDYDEDYTQLSALGRGMKTLYRVGKGIATDESDVAADDEPPSEATDDPETRPPEVPTPDESERQMAAPSATPSRAESRAPAESARNPKGAARSRRWGTPENPS